jgi:hypothetical protein
MLIDQLLPCPLGLGYCDLAQWQLLPSPTT